MCKWFLCYLFDSLLRNYDKQQKRSCTYETAADCQSSDPGWRRVEKQKREGFTIKPSRIEVTGSAGSIAESR
jgi:hypothetical protein